MGQAHDLWRQAALENRLQFFGMRDSLSSKLIREDAEYSWPASHYEKCRAQCGVTLLSSSDAGAKLRDYFTTTKMMFDCGCEVSMTEATVHRWIVHLNNAHKWDWLDFANKFPEIDEQRSQ